MPPQDDVPSLLSEFSAVPLERWRAKVEADGVPQARLRARSLEGPDVRALYSADDPAAGPRPPARTPGWSIGLEYGGGEAASLAQALGEDRARGLEVAWVEGAALQPDDVPALLAALGPDVALHLHAGLAAPAMLAALLEHRGAEGPADAVLVDPLATLATAGSLPVSVDDAYAALAGATREAAKRRPSVRTIVVDAVAVHDAGASAEQEVAYAIAAGIEHLRRLETQGLSAAEAMPHVVLRMAVGSDLLLEVAKLRAARRLWARVRAHAGADGGPTTPLWVRTSWRASTRRDPWVNMLRGSVGGLAAVLGGASAVAVQPFTEALGVPRADARRWAINTQHILRGESHLGVVDDPVGGSWAFEALTDALAQGAWGIARGWLSQGVVEVLHKGVLQAEIAERSAARSQALATGKLVATGTSAYPQLDETTPPTDGEATAAPAAEKAEPGVRVMALPRRRPVEPFEALRDRSDAVTQAKGSRPRAALVPVGPPRQARGQIDFARNFVSVGGFAAETLDAGAPWPEGVSLAVLCAPAEALAEHGPAEAQRLVAAGARVLVAGRPTDALRDAGVHDFVHRGRDVVALLGALQSKLFPSRPETDR